MLIEPKTTALVLIDLQKGVLGRSIAPHSADAIYQRAKHLAQRLRTHKTLIVHVRASFAPDFADALHTPVDEPSNYAAFPPGWDEFPEPLPVSDLVITKHQWGAFHGTDLDLQLRRRGIRRILLGGIATNMGVESTARHAHELGYELVLLEDLCGTFTQEMHEFSFRYIMPRLSRVTTSEKISLP